MDHAGVIAATVLGLGLSVGAMAQEGPQVLNDRRFVEGRDALGRGETEQALESWRALCQARADDGLTWLVVADAWVNAQQYEHAEEFAKPALEKLPNVPRAHVVYGAALLYTDRAAAAEAHYRSSVGRFPDHANLWYSLGMASGMNQKILEAQGHYEKALALEEGHALFLYTAGENSLLLGRNTEAADFFKRAVQAKPPHPNAKWKLATALSNLGRDEPAEAWFRRALKGAAKGPAAYHYGVFLYERGRVEEALVQLDAVLEDRPDHRMGWNYRARCLRALGQAEAAREALNQYRALQRTADAEEERYLLSLLSEQLGAGQPAPDRGKTKERNTPRRDG